MTKISTSAAVSSISTQGANGSCGVEANGLGGSPPLIECPAPDGPPAFGADRVAHVDGAAAVLLKHPDQPIRLASDLVDDGAEIGLAHRDIVEPHLSDCRGAGIDERGDGAAQQLEQLQACRRRHNILPSAPGGRIAMIAATERTLATAATPLNERQSTNLGSE